MTTVRTELQLQKPASRWLGRAGALFGAAAVVQIVALLIQGGSWAGAVSLRKPITFSISFGLLLWTCGWIIDRLPQRPRLEGGLAAVLIGSGSIEVGLISMQAWRGVASHFNYATPGDAAIFNAMAVAVGVFSLGLAALAVWALIQRPNQPSTRLAVLAGMGLLMTGLGLGAWVITLGLEIVEQLGAAPDTVLAGEAGVAKFPHAMALHGLQVFIGASVIARVVGLSARDQLRTTRLVVWGYTSIVAWSIVHTNAGRAPADLSGVESTLGLIGAALLAGAAVELVQGWRHAHRQPAETLIRPPVTLRS